MEHWHQCGCAGCSSAHMLLVEQKEHIRATPSTLVLQEYDLYLLSQWLKPISSVIPPVSARVEPVVRWVVRDVDLGWKHMVCNA